MSILETLVGKMGISLVKALMRKYAGPEAAAVGGNVIDHVKDKISDYGQSRQTERRFLDIADKIIEQLVPIFEQELNKQSLNTESVALELANAVESLDASFFLNQNLNPEAIIQELKSSRKPSPGLSEAELSLYDKALPKLIRYLVEIANQLPQFDVQYAAQSLQRLSDVNQQTEAIFERVRNIENVLLQQQQENDYRVSSFEGKYRAAVINSLDYLELIGVDIDPVAERQKLSVAYISLNLQNKKGKDADAQRLDFSDMMDQVALKTRRLLIEGPAGSGKSTLLRWTAIKAAEGLGASRISFYGQVVQDTQSGRLLPHLVDQDQWLSIPTKAFESLIEPSEGNAEEVPNEVVYRILHQRWWRFKLPFLIKLRNCQSGQLPKPSEYPQLIASTLDNTPEHWVVDILDRGHGLVILDGIDEIPNHHRAEIRRQIEQLVQTYPDNFYVISTRPQAIDENWFTDLDFDRAQINPMNPGDRSEFIDKWHEAVAGQLVSQGKVDNISALANSLKAKLDTNPSIAQLATNPLLCASICALHQYRNEYLPKNQADLCKALCEMIVDRRDRESGLSLKDYPAAYRDLEYKQKKELLQELARYMVCNGESRISEQRAEELVSDTLKLFPNNSDEDADAIYRGLAERSGMLRAEGQDSVGFIHNTLKEYLAAECFVAGKHSGQLVLNALETSWQPVVLFAAALGTEDFATELIHKLLDASEKLKRKNSHQRWTLNLMALRCQSLAVRLSSELQERLKKVWKREFVIPNKVDDAEVVAALGETVVPFLIHQSGMPFGQAAACVRALRLIGTESAQQKINGYLSDTRKTVINELVQAVEPLSIKSVRRDFVKGKKLPNSTLKEIRDLTLLIEQEPKLTKLDLSGTQIDELTTLLNFKYLKTLKLGRHQSRSYSHAKYNVSYVEAKVKNLTQIPQLLAKLVDLEEIFLCGSQIRDLTPLQRLTKLKNLDLIETNISDLNPVQNLEQLNALDLSKSKNISNIKPLTGLSRLHSLNLSGTSVSDLHPIQELSSLRVLNIDYTKVDDLSPLQNLQQLESLGFYNQETQFADLGFLGDLSNLKYLDLLYSTVKNPSTLQNLTQLKSLFSSNICDLSFLKNLTKLEFLHLRKSEISDLSPLGGLSQLRHLWIGLSNAADLSVLQNLPKLKYLHIDTDGLKKDIDLRPLRDLSNINSISLNHTNIGDLTPLQNLPNLESLNLSYSTVNDLIPLQNLSKLQSLYIYSSNIKNLEGEIKRLKTCLPKLKIHR